MAIINYQVTEQVQTSENDFQPVPAGKYKVIIEEVTVNQTKAGTGEYLRLKLRVAEGQQYANRIIWTYINFRNANQTAERIGQQKLNQLLLSCGLMGINDTDELLNRSVDAQVTIREASNGYEASNDIKAFYKSEVKAPSGAFNSQPTQAKQNDNLPPWHTAGSAEFPTEAPVPF